MSETTYRPVTTAHWARSEEAEVAQRAVDLTECRQGSSDPALRARWADTPRDAVRPEPTRGRPRARGDDVRRVREPDRAQAQQARRGGRVGELCDRAGRGSLRSRARDRRRSARRGRVGRLPRGAGSRGAECPVDRADAVRRRLVVAAALTAPLVVLAMVMPLQFEGWEWLALALATPVVFWAGFDFHRAAALNARHGAATMDTLISIGTLAAWGWSVAALVDRRRRRRLLRGCRSHHDAHPPRAAISRLVRGAARARRSARSSSSARRRHASCGTAWRSPSRSASSPLATSSSSVRARRSRRTVSSSRASRQSTSRC